MYIFLLPPICIEINVITIYIRVIELSGYCRRVPAPVGVEPGPDMTFKKRKPHPNTTKKSGSESKVEK